MFACAMAPSCFAVAFSVTIFHAAWAATCPSQKSCQATDEQSVSQALATQLFQYRTREREHKDSQPARLNQDMTEAMEGEDNVGPCVWGRPHNVKGKTDKPLCSDGVFSWNCKSKGHGNRLQCPGQTPVMCAEMTCDGGRDYCCEVEGGCKDGPRRADNCPIPSEPPHGCAPKVPVDLIFLVDSSGSVGSTGFDQSRHFLREVTQRLPVYGSNSSTHVGIVQYSTLDHESIEIDLTEGTTQESVEKALDKMEWHRGKLHDPMTHTGEAIQYLIDNMFPKFRGGSSAMLVIVTDGHSNGDMKPAGVAAKAREDGVTVVAVGIRDFDDDEKVRKMDEEMMAIVGGDKSKYLSVDSYSELVNIYQNTSKMICEHSDPIVPTPAPTPRPTGPCLWGSPHNMPDRQEPMCEDGAFAWDCVGNGHGHRLQCSSIFPVMCNATKCGSPSRKNYCCEKKAGDCDKLGGVRPANNCLVPEPPEHGCTPQMPLDLVFLMDGSGSIGKKGYDQSRMFLKKVAQHLPLDQGNVSTQVGIVQFSDEGKESVELTDGITFKEVEHAVNHMKWHGTKVADPMTHTGEAIDFVLDNVFPSVVSGGEEHLLAIITDGKANGKKDPAAMAAKARERGIDIIAIGVADYDMDELVNMTSDQSKVLTVESHSKLLSIVNATAEVFCQTAASHQQSEGFQ